MQVFSNERVDVTFFSDEKLDVTHLSLMQQILGVLHADFPKAVGEASATVMHQEPYRYGYTPLWGMEKFGYTIAQEARTALDELRNVRNDVTRKLEALLPSILKGDITLDDIPGSLAIVHKHLSRPAQIRVWNVSEDDVGRCIELVQKYPEVPFIFNGHPLTDESVERMRAAGCRVAFPQEPVPVLFSRDGAMTLRPLVKKPE